MKRFFAVFIATAMLFSMMTVIPVSAENKYTPDLSGYNGSTYWLSEGTPSYDAETGLTINKTGGSPSLSIFLGQNGKWENSYAAWYHVSYDVRMPDGPSASMGNVGTLALLNPATSQFSGFIMTPQYAKDGSDWKMTFKPDNTGAYESRAVDLSEWTTIEYWIEAAGEKSNIYISVNGEIKGPYENSYKVEALQSLGFGSTNQDPTTLQIRNVYAETKESGPELPPKENKYTPDLSGYNGSTYWLSEGTPSYDAETGLTINKTGGSPSLSIFLGQNGKWENSYAAWYHVSYDVRMPDGPSASMGNVGTLALLNPATSQFSGFIMTPQYAKDGSEWKMTFQPDNAGAYESRAVDLSEWTTIEYWIEATGEKSNIYISVNGEIKGPYENSYKVEALQSLGFGSTNQDPTTLQIRNVYAETKESGPELPPKENKYIPDLSGYNGSTYWLSEGTPSYDVENGLTINKTGGSPSLSIFLGQNGKWENSYAAWYHVSYDVRMPDGPSDSMGKVGSLALLNPEDNKFAGFILQPQYAKDGSEWKMTFQPDNAGAYESRAVDLSEWTTIEYWIEAAGEKSNLYIGVNGEIKGPYENNYKVKALQSLEFFSVNQNPTTLQIRNVYAETKDSGPAKIEVAFMDSYGGIVRTATAGQEIYVKVGNLGQASAAQGVIVKSDGTEAESFAVAVGEKVKLPSAEAASSYEIRFLSADEKVIDHVSLPVFDAMDASFGELYNKGNLNVAYLGGSITEGAGASNSNNRWSTKITQWLNTLDLGNTSFTEINAGIGGTPSTYGLLRTQRDVISKNPDVVFIEFSLNDESLSESVSARAYEGIIRQLMGMEKIPYVICVGVVANRTNPTRANLHREIAAHYGLQYIDIQEYMDSRLGDAAPGSNLERDKLYTSDNTHPNDAGYAFYTDFLKTQINCGSWNKPNASSPVRTDYYPFSGTFVNADYMEQQGAWTPYGEGDWNEANLAQNGSGLQSRNPDASLTYEFFGQVLLIGHRIGTNFGKMLVSVDGEPEQEIDLYYQTNNQPVTWYTRMDLEDTMHTVTIRPSGTKNNLSSAEDIKIDFILVSSDNEPGKPPEEKPYSKVDIVLNPNSGFDNGDNPENTWTVTDGVGTLDIKQIVGFQSPSLKIPLEGIRSNDYYRIKYSMRIPSSVIGPRFIAGALRTSTYYFTADRIEVIRPTWYGDAATIGVDNWNFYYGSWDNVTAGSSNFWLVDTTKGSGEEWADIEYVIEAETGKVQISSSASPGNVVNGTVTEYDGSRYLGIPTELFFAGLDGSAAGKEKITFQIKDISVESFAKPWMKVVETSIAEGVDDISVIDGTVPLDLKFDYKLLEGTDVTQYIKVNGGEQSFTAVLDQDLQTVHLLIQNAKEKQTYTVTVSKSIPVSPGQKNAYGAQVSGMKEDYTLTFATQKPAFDVVSVTFADGSEIKDLASYRGKDAAIKVKLQNNAAEDMPDIQVFAVLVDTDGTTVDIDRAALPAMEIGQEQNTDFTLSVPDDARTYYIEIYTWTNTQNIRPLYQKMVYPQ
ncbi:SGNH/GDSL hydrolase family protein [Ructibacterium gallinarum]|uniref:SGNH/GDSL hydrolase family protein n=1 Tax=Ructibacterium gallinarum TaxID=2779355 RepID=A0A9D5LXI8_9FIRM|nr:SGNH/GDSL hydrolase family protein [Ructibacterium gallinarum]MBE5039708.1 SGNH/GDSL hydrolase family protein [Ructibacterium gallinarum]